MMIGFMSWVLPSSGVVFLWWVFLAVGCDWEFGGS